VDLSCPEYYVTYVIYLYQLGPVLWFGFMLLFAVAELLVPGNISIQRFCYCDDVLYGYSSLQSWNLISFTRIDFTIYEEKECMLILRETTLIEY
jgi:hypothetical protein